MFSNLKNRVVMVVVLLVALAGVAQAQVVDDFVRWFSQRIYVVSGHPVLMGQGGPLSPGPMLAYFIADERNRNLCVMVLVNKATGQMLSPVAVDAASCR